MAASLRAQEEGFSAQYSLGTPPGNELLAPPTRVMTLKETGWHQAERDVRAGRRQRLLRPSDIGIGLPKPGEELSGCPGHGDDHSDGLGASSRTGIC